MTNLFDEFIDPKFFYNCKIISVYDGDTLRADIDCGFNVILKNQQIRFFGINTAELRDSNPDKKEDAYEARDLVRSLVLNENNKVELYSIKDESGKYGRYLGIFIIKTDTETINLNQLLIDKGYTKFVTY